MRAEERRWVSVRNGETSYPASDAQVEGPSIVVSDDGYAWSVAVRLTNPISPGPAGAVLFPSDPNLVVHPDGTFYLFYRKFDRSASAKDIDYTTSTDLATLGRGEALARRP